MVCCVDGRFYGLELKNERGTISQSQREFGRHLEFAGGTYRIAKGLNQALECLEEWGVLERDKGKRPSYLIAVQNGHKANWNCAS